MFMRGKLLGRVDHDKKLLSLKSAAYGKFACVFACEGARENQYCVTRGVNAAKSLRESAATWDQFVKVDSFADEHSAL